MARLKLTIRARQDITELAGYIANDSPQKASLFTLHLIKKCQWVAEHPFMGRPRTDLAAGLRSTVFGNHIIFYQVLSDIVEITRVLHGSRNIKHIMRDS